MEKKQIDISSENHYDLPNNLVEFIAHFQDKLDQIPEDQKESAQIDINFGEWSAGFDVFYTREETEEELKERLAADNQILVARRDTLKAQLDRINTELSGQKD